MSGDLEALGNAIQIVMWAWILFRYARGWRLEWHRHEGGKR